MKEEEFGHRKSTVYVMMAASAFVLGFAFVFFLTISQVVNAGETRSNADRRNNETLIAAAQNTAPLSFYEQAVAFYASGQYQDAVVNFTHAIEQSPNNAELYARRGNTYLVLNRLDQAAQDFEQAMLLTERLAHEGWLIYYDAGRTACAEQRYGDALQYLARSIELAPVNYLPYYQRAEVYTALGYESYAAADYTQVVTLLSDMIAADASNTELYHRRAIIYQKLGDNAHALSDLLTITDLKPNDPEGYRNVGWFYVVQGQYEHALPYYRYTVQLTPQSYEPYGDLGWLYVRLKDYGQAVAYYTRALELDPAQSWRRLERADVYLVQGTYPEAITDYTYLIDVHWEQLNANSSLAKVYNRRAWAYAALGNYDQAAADQMQALTIDPDGDTFFKPYFELSIDLQGDRESLIAFYERLLGINPVDSVVAQRLADLLGIRGQAFYFAGNYDAAIVDFERLKQLELLVRFMIQDPDQALITVFYRRAQAYETAGDYANAIHDYHRVGEYSGYTQEMVLHLGDLYYQVQNFVDALAYYEYTVQLGGYIPDYVLERINQMRVQ